jgi:DNA replication protein DnaC
MNQKKPAVLLEHYLKQLKLPTMLREYTSLAATCSKERVDYPTYLLRLVERELIDRERRAAERRVKSARFPVIKMLDTFDFKAQPSINQTLIRELMAGEYLDRHENILFVGNSGTGKTHDLLVLDELGYVPFSKAGAELLFDVISRAYERTSLIVTTNLPFENWTDVMGSERLTGALLDRLTHRVHILEANGESYRLRDSRQRLKRREK